MILKEAIEQFLFHCRYEKNLSPKTLKAYAIDLRQVSDFLVANLPATHLEAIDKVALRLYIKGLFTGLAEKSVKRKVASLKVLFHFLEREDLIAVNPFRRMDVRIKETKRIPRALSLPDLKCLFHHLYQAKRTSPDRATPHYRALVRDIAVLETLFATGARVAEVCHLRLDDVDLVQGRVRILGKGARERLLHLPNQDTLASLLDYRALWLDPAPEDPYFFHNRLGRRLSEQSVRSMLRRQRLAAVRNPVTVERGDLAQTTSSSIRLPGRPPRSSSTGSRYSSTASRRLAIAYSAVSPSLTQPGSEGT
jgi:integrase/recombinase XerD